KERYDAVGAVLQAYLKRSLADLDRLLEKKVNVRICKGIYVEPRTIAWQDRQTIIRNYGALVEKQLAGGAYAAIATHDEGSVQLALAPIARFAAPKDRYEFQMLLGVAPVLRRGLLEAGHRRRVYVPYGRDWYAYSPRRLKENPSIARHVLKS